MTTTDLESAVYNYFVIVFFLSLSCLLFVARLLILFGFFWIFLDKIIISSLTITYINNIYRHLIHT